MGVLEDVARIARGNDGVVTVGEIRDAGWDESALRHLASRREDLVSYYKGVYQFYDDDDEFDLGDLSEMQTRVALAVGGEGSYLWGETVLDYFNLAFANPSYIEVATAKVRARADRGYIRLIPQPKNTTRINVWRGIPMQNLADAFLAAPQVRKSYRIEGCAQARERGLLTESEYEAIVAALQGNEGNGD